MSDSDSIQGDSPSKPTPPAGWRGYYYPIAIEDIPAYVEWLSLVIRARDELLPQTALGRSTLDGQSTGDVLHNAYLMADRLNLTGLPPQPISILTVEQETVLLKNLRRKCLRLLEGIIAARDQGGAAQDKGGEQPGKRGRKSRYNPQKDEEIADDWERAKGAGISKKEHARSLNFSLRDLNRVLNRHAKRAKRMRARK